MSPADQDEILAKIAGAATRASLIGAAIAAMPCLFSVLDADGTVLWMAGAEVAALNLAGIGIVGERVGTWGQVYWDLIQANSRAGTPFPLKMIWPGKRIPGSTWVCTIARTVLPGGGEGYVIQAIRLDDADRSAMEPTP